MPGHTIGTAVIGLPVRQEVEVSQGSDLSIDVSVPIGTAGTSFVSNFRHERFGTSALPILTAGQVAQGSFSVNVTSNNTVQLRSGTSLLLPGRYLYDISATSSYGTSVSSLREFRVLGSVTGGVGSAITPPVNSVQQLIDASVARAITEHNTNLSAHPGITIGSGGSAQFDVTFTDAQLTVSGVFVTPNLLPTLPSSITVYNNVGVTVIPASVSSTLASIVIDLADFAPLLGIWSLSVTN